MERLAIIIEQCIVINAALTELKIEHLENLVLSNKILEKMKDPEDDKLLTIQEASKFLNKDAKHIYKSRKKGSLKAEEGDGPIRFLKSELNRYKNIM